MINFSCREPMFFIVGLSPPALPKMVGRCTWMKTAITRRSKSLLWLDADMVRHATQEISMKATKSLIALAIASGTFSTIANADFFADSKGSLELRNFYFNRDF